MDDPLHLPSPDDPIQQIHDLARDLAYLAAQKQHSPRITLGTEGWGGDPRKQSEHDGPVLAFFRVKWGNLETYKGPQFEMLSSYAYLTMLGSDPNNLLLTQKAFDLLDAPATPPRIFISYRRRESSALALLIEARLRLVGVDTVFIDKNIAAGDEWHGELEAKIRQCQTFMCLIGPHSLESPMVAKELGWAMDAGCRIISIWHNGYTMGDDCPEELKQRQSITVTGESAKEYETAISELLNSLGYRTY
jgi:TIR domain